MADLVDSLLVALDATPSNHALLEVILEKLAEQRAWARASDVLDRYAPESLPPALHRLAGEIYVAAQKASRALPFLEGDEPKSALVRARALLQLERAVEARAAYRAAIEANPALEDPALEALLGAREVRVAGERPRLRLISADDTDAADLARAIRPADEPVTFADVGGLDEIKEQIRRRIILPFQKPSLFRRFRRGAGGGILMYGPPGCGKTLLARATAGECAARFINVAISDVLDMYIGESERKLSALFTKARERVPAVLFFDELEALGGTRQHRRDASTANLVSTFLTELDGFADNNHGVLILAATNVPWAVDLAFRRPGRFDRVLFVPPPDRPARRAILELLFADRPVSKGVKADELAAATSGYSGADLRSLVEAAIDLAIEESIASESPVDVSAAHVRSALKEGRRTTTEWLQTAQNYARYSNDGGQYDAVLEFLRKHTE